MVLMALDHARDFFGDNSRDPLDLSTTTTLLFFTRWITHFCAPVFVLLAGVSAYVSSTSTPSTEASWLLVKRGLWLVVLEVTVVRFGWLFNVNYHFSFVQVIWAIGWSMVALAALSRLGARACLALGVAMIATHNLADGVTAERFGAMGWLWHVLHLPARLQPVEGYRVYVAYPLVPWVGVMAAGYGLGPLMARADTERRRVLLRLGTALTVAFVALRALNLYGDPQPWRAWPRVGATLLSFLNCEKYPPSLLYLLMTLGPAFLVWGALTGRNLSRARTVVTFGRVPLFYYVVHLPLLHTMAGVWLYVRGGRAAIEAAHRSRVGTGGNLALVYAAWALAIALLWPLSRWFDGVKTRHRGTWWTRYA
jgi:uncharacterized membrane protein